MVDNIRKESFSIAVLLTVYNRKEITLQGLSTLYAAIAVMPESYAFDIYMTDDGCTDGTADAVAERFPQVKIIKGDGSLYWGGGMNAAWKVASKEKDYDYYLWMNDDAKFYPNSIELLFDVEKREGYNALVSGVFEDENHHVSYGGKDRNTTLLPLGYIQDVYYMNGNLVLIPRIVFVEVGLIDELFIHGHGDYDYGLRAQQKGFPVKLTDEYVGMASRHDDESRKIYKSSYTLKERLGQLYSIKSSPIITFKFHLRHRGLFYAIYKFVRKNVATIIPSIYHTLRK